MALKVVELLQKSALFLILFLFFNNDLVKIIINKNKKAITFIDDYTAWIIELDIKSNIKHLQITVIPKLEVLAKGSSAIFNLKKIVIVYFIQS